MDDETINTKRNQIIELTKLGHKTLSNGFPSKACEIFQSAYTHAEDIGITFLLRGCSFNLGSCYVACGEAHIGLSYLEKAIPPADVEDGVENYADLWYNIGVARHAVGDIEKAQIAYQKASTGYNELDSKKLEGECLSKLAVCYHLQGQLENSYRMYEKAQKLYNNIGERNSQAMSLLNATGVLTELGDIDRCAKVLDLLLDVCQSVDDKHLQAKIYHDIGLLYISEKLYESAGECFEQSLKCLQQYVIDDKLLKATVLQNLGASSNFLKLYEQAVKYHQAAADLYGELKNRQAQTQVFGNLAYAQSHLGNNQEAIMAFNHAIQAAKDCNDKDGQCLATEGLAALWFRLNEHEKAVNCYKETLLLLTMANKTSNEDADRIVQKLTDAIQSQLLEQGQTVERTLAESNAEKYREEIQSKRYPRPKLSKDKQQSLIAKGLDESSCEDSSDQDSGSDDLEDSVEVYEKALVYSSSKSDDRKRPKKKRRYKKTNNNRLQNDGLNFSMRSTLTQTERETDGEESLADDTNSTNHQPADYALDVPRADLEYDLATLAQNRNTKRNQDGSEELKESSRMCSVM